MPIDAALLTPGALRALSQGDVDLIEAAIKSSREPLERVADALARHRRK